jgi:CDP-diacylglycerol pyrophosphatase
LKNFFWQSWKSRKFLMVLGSRLGFSLLAHTVALSRDLRESSCRDPGFLRFFSIR